jgi:hypothetical protein
MGTSYEIHKLRKYHSSIFVLPCPVIWFLVAPCLIYINTIIKGKRGCPKGDKYWCHIRVTVRGKCHARVL